MRDRIREGARADIEALLSEQRFLRTWAFELVELDVGVCGLRLPFRQSSERPGGVVNGPALMAAADASMWFAIVERVGREEGERCVTIDLKTAFLSGAKGDVVCTSRIEKLGRRVIYGNAESRDGAGVLVAHHTVTYLRPADS